MKRLSVTDPLELKRSLRRSARQSEEARFISRLQCVALVAAGNSCRSVAEWTGENARTVQLWVNRYNKHGLSGLKERSKQASSRGLNKAETEALRRDLLREPRAFGYEATQWDGPLFCRHLSEHYGLQFSTRHCQRLLRKLRTALNGWSKL